MNRMVHANGIKRIELSTDQADETELFDRRLGEDLSLLFLLCTDQCVETSFSAVLIASDPNPLYTFFITGM